MASEKLTKRHIDGLRPATKMYRHYDIELKGFGVQVLPSGIKSYIVEYRPDGGGRNVAKKRMTLGRVGEITPDQARALARDRLAEVRHGTDPLSDRQTKRREMKLSEFIDQWETDAPVSKRTGRPMKELTRSYMLARLRHHVVPILGRKRVSDVTVDDINDMIRRIAKGETAKDAPSAKKRGRIKVRGGEGAALKVASDLSIIFNYAIERRLVPTNPVTHARKPRAGKRHEFLSAAEFTLIGQALTELEAEGCNPAGIAILRLILLTGARPSEIESLTWAEVDFDHQCLRLAQSKTGYSVRPLAMAAVNILSAIERSKSPYVFPATRGEGHFTGAKKIWNQARSKAGLPGRVRYHARHAMATFALADGVDAVSVAAILGHKGPRTTLATYAHVIDKSAAHAVENVGGKIATALLESASLIPGHRP
ncbi:MAG TPA: site-specific integrase [Sphingorhabdus sp.]|jgi:integrase|nr:site-specific integrase [Sphingorhabdus sp.]